MDDEEKKKHEQTKKKLKIIGTVLIVLGIVCEVVGMLDFEFAANNQRMPTLFFLTFLGAPCIFVGIVLLIFGCRKEIMSYTKNEVVPVVNDATEELKPAIKSVVGAVKEGLKDGEGETKSEEKRGIFCPVCGSLNQPENKFCDKCGTQLIKVCPRCGAKQDCDDKFCGECGARLD